MNDTITHPSWCAQRYRCTASRGGEHLSRPLTFPAAGGPISTVVSLARRHTDTRPLVEFRLRVRLDALGEAGQLRQVRRLLDRLHAALTEVGR